MCSRPLVDWFPSNHRAGMVLIDVPESSDKFFGSFFLASTPGHHFIIRWRDLFARYLAPPPDRMSGAQVKRLVRKIPLARPKLGRVLLVTPLVRQKFGSPYFALHYLGTWLLMSSPPGSVDVAASAPNEEWKIQRACQTSRWSRRVPSEARVPRLWGMGNSPTKCRDDQRDLFNGVIAVAEDFVAQHPATD